MISESTQGLIQVDDRTVAGGPERVHGAAFRSSVSTAVCGDRAPLRIPRGLQIQVGANLCRYREIERRELDRHSYEIQIK